MINVSTTYDNLIANGGQYEWQIVNGANTYDKTNIMNGTITQTQFQEFSVGNVVAAELDLNLWNTPSVDTSSPLSVQFRATDGSSTSAWYTKGIFFIDTIESSPYSEVTHITAFDAMLKTEVVYLKTGTWTETDSYSVLSRIASDIGVSIEAATQSVISDDPITMSNAPDMGENGTTDREMLSIIGVLHGCNFIIDSSGNLKAIWSTGTIANTANIGDAVVSFDASPAETVTRVKIWLNSSTYFRKPSADDGVTDEAFDAMAGLCLEAECPYYAEQIVANNLHTMFNGYTNKPYTAQGAYADPKYEIGDGITIKDVTSIIANQTLNIDPLAPSDLEIRGEEILQSYYPYISPVHREVVRSEERTQASITVLEDSIQSEVSARVLQGESLTQDINDNANALQTAINDTNATVTELSSSLTQTATEINATITKTQTNLQDYAEQQAQTAADDLAATLATYIRYYQSGGTGVLELGDNASGYTARLNNQKLSFYDGDTEVAYISNNKLYIANGQVTGDLQIGKYQWLTDSTGRMSLKWVG